MTEHSDFAEAHASPGPAPKPFRKPDLFQLRRDVDEDLRTARATLAEAQSARREAGAALVAAEQAREAAEAVARAAGAAADGAIAYVRGVIQDAEQQAEATVKGVAEDAAEARAAATVAQQVARTARDQAKSTRGIAFAGLVLAVLAIAAAAVHWLRNP